MSIRKEIRKRKRKGQLTFNGILIGFLLLTVYIAILPVMNDLIGQVLGQVSGMTKIVLLLFPLFILLAIIKSIWGYSEAAI